MLFYFITKFYIHLYKCAIVSNRFDKKFISKYTRKTKNLLLNFAEMIEVDL